MRAARGGGRGGGFSGRAWVRDGVDRRGPVVDEEPPYPPNPELRRAAPLDREMSTVVLIHRLLSNYWRSSEFRVDDRRPKREVMKFSNRLQAQVYDLELQKEAIISHCDPVFFPPELLQSKLVRPTRGIFKGSASDSRRQRLREMEQKESESKGGDEKQRNPATEERNEEEMFPAEDAEDFGGDDYAHDYYADEDLDDHLDEADDGGVF
ncbi:dna-directed rna polymerase iii subunit rpc31 [Cystoisospora suis]|uniref:Dna-directed rna polymerase iii subunit rpc31 n=1 Tax=Cystoisospora suis TaxID=483139 RepID=A0A2C6KJX1_9APIC|nr:dna-directed rna polymerase iii subunit rpc31 [Cystoisospora suis]